MSILNVYIEHDRALVAVDTQTLAPDGDRRDMSKLLMLPHAGTAIASRGEIGFFGWVFNAAFASGAAGYDELCGKMPEILAQTEQQYRQFARTQGVETFTGYKIALVGWSDAIGRMLGVCYQKWPDWEAMRAAPISPWILSPNAGWEQTPTLPDDLEQASRDQVAVLRKFPCVAAGGRLLVAELTRHAATVQNVCELG